MTPTLAKAQARQAALATAAREAVSEDEGMYAGGDAE